MPSRLLADRSVPSRLLDGSPRVLFCFRSAYAFCSATTTYSRRARSSGSNCPSTTLVVGFGFSCFTPSRGGTAEACSLVWFGLRCIVQHG